MKYSKFHFVLGFLVLSLGTSHTIAQENFANAWPAITYYSKTRVKVAVFDAREYVRSGKKDRSYLGVVRDVYGIPRSIYTASSMPLADDLETAINNGFANAGMTSSIADPATKTIRKSTHPEEKLLVVSFSEWISDSYRNSVGFTYKATVDVYDYEGSMIASVASESTKTFSSPLEGGRDALTALLSNKDIIASLSNKKQESSRQTFPSTDSGKREATSRSDTKDRLLALKELLDAGVISNADYEKKKKEILDLM